MLSLNPRKHGCPYIRDANGLIEILYYQAISKNGKQQEVAQVRTSFVILCYSNSMFIRSFVNEKKENSISGERFVPEKKVRNLRVVKMT